MCHVCANCPGGVEDPPGRLIVLGMVIGEQDLVPGLGSGRQTAQLARPAAGLGSADSLSRLAMLIVQSSGDTKGDTD
jgi:hypothetical protein